MKAIILWFVALLSVSVTNATVRTVSNDPNGGAQFSSLLNAYNASTNGDTLLMEGTNIAYTFGGEWIKSLVVIGIGFNPQKANPRLTFITTLTMNSNVNSGGNGSRFYGIEFTTVTVGAGASIANLLFENCSFYDNFRFPTQFNTQTASNIVLRNCIFKQQNNSNINFSPGQILMTGVLVTNCIFNGYLNGNSNTVSTPIIDHCIFLINDGSTVLRNFTNATFTNNIFMNSASLHSGSSNTFISCISRLGGIPTGAGNTGNFNNTNPNFVNYTLGSFYSTPHNYQVQAGSVAIGAGSDLTDIGVHGGNSNFNESGEVLIAPIMRLLIINNQNVQPNGTLNVQVNATKPTGN